jgi:hypothetical protein
MSAVLLAVFNEYPTAERVRTALVKDGFPTDRVELSALSDPGRAAEQPAASRRAKLEQYFRTLLSDRQERSFVDALLERLNQGAAAVTVQPRGEVETVRAVEILEGAGAAEVIGHDLADQSFEQAASRDDRPWVRYFTREADSLVLPSKRTDADDEEE